MGKKGLIFVSLLLLALGLGLAGLGEEEKLLVVTTTSILADFAAHIGGDLVEIYTITPAGICPAHYDVKPSDIRAVAQAVLVLYHGMEAWLEDLIQASGNTDVKRVQVKGPWNVPSEIGAYLDQIEAALAEVDPAHAEQFKANAQGYKAEIDTLAGELLAKAKELELAQAKAIVMQWQQGFVAWIGVQVVATYPPPETLSLKQVQELINTGRKEQVALVVDNLQSGTSFGARLAYEIGAVHVVLTNFPGAVPGALDYLGMLRYNADQLFTAWKAYSGRE